MRQEVNPPAVTPLFIAANTPAIGDSPVGAHITVVGFAARRAWVLSGDAHEWSAGLIFMASIVYTHVAV
jgi:hypothetical protein